MMRPVPAPAGPVLRDIHLPPAPSWWPPAPGWWLLAALALLLAAGGAWLWLRVRRRRRYRTGILAQVDTLAELHAGEPQALAAGLHQLLRRVARLHDPATARLRGEAWRAALASVPVDADTLDRLLALEPAMYQPRPYDVPAMLEAVRGWVRAALVRQTGRVRRA